MTPFDLLGGEAGVRALVDRFYALMDSLPEAATIRALHPPDLAESNEKLALFLIGRFGGPNLYVERFGHPRLRARHLPFPIATAEAAAWMLCMNQAMDELISEPALRQALGEFFEQTATFMRNRPD